MATSMVLAILFIGVAIKATRGKGGGAGRFPHTVLATCLPPCRNICEKHLCRDRHRIQPGQFVKQKINL
jgi:hypothetical protein